jgi:hemerythrin-like domain-containing protein
VHGQCSFEYLEARCENTSSVRERKLIRVIPRLTSHFGREVDDRRTIEVMFIRIGAASDHGFDEPLGLLSDCHRRIEHFLNVIAVVTGAASGRRLTPAEITNLRAALRYFATAAPKHTADEESSLFPQLRSCGEAAGDVLETVARLERDHAEADRRHGAVAELLERWIADGELDGSAAAELEDHVRSLQRIYREHIAVEDQQVFPEAARLLSPDQLRVIGNEMAARRGIESDRTR